MKSHLRMLGRKVTSPPGIIVNTCSQEGQLMVKVKADDGSHTWAKLSDVTLVAP